MIRRWFCMLLTVPGFACGAEALNDFAYGIELSTPGNEALYRVELPSAVYLTTTRIDLGDLRVFNADGEVLPHALRRLPDRDVQKKALVDLPFFPLYGAENASVEELAIRITRNRDGGIVDIDRRDKPRGSQLLAYLIDASRLSEAIQALELDWTVPPSGYFGRIRVEASDDLTHWTVLHADAPIAQLQFGGQTLSQKRIEFAARKSKFIRISWPGQSALALNRAAVEPAATSVAAQRRWQVATTTPHSEPGEYHFDASGRLPVDRARLDLPQENTLAQAQLLARNASNEAWRPIASGVIYTLLQKGQVLRSPEWAFAPASYRYWLLRIDQQRGGLGRGAPSLHLGFLPHELIFVARGTPPFRVAFGSAKALPTALPIESLIPNYREELEIPFAQAGQHYSLSKERALRAPIDWRRWTLWSVLVVGVIVLVWMAWRLSKQTEIKSE